MKWFDRLHASFTRTEGLLWGGKYYVLYPDGAKSIRMPFGNAVDYAKMFNGKVLNASPSKGE